MKDVNEEYRSGLDCIYKLLETLVFWVLDFLQVELKDYVISLYLKQMNESEAQHRSAQIKHLSMLDALLDLHYLRTTVNISQNPNLSRSCIPHNDQTHRT